MSSSKQNGQKKAGVAKKAKPKPKPRAKNTLTQAAPAREKVEEGKPLSHRQELFCESIASGQSQTQAYLDAGYVCSRESAAVEACKLVRIPRVANEIKRLRDETLALKRMTREEYLAWCQDVMTTPICDVDDASIYAQEKTVKTLTTNDGPEIIETKIKMVPKMAAAVQFAKIAGLEKPTEIKIDLTARVSSIVRLIRRPKDEKQTTIDV